MKRVGPFPVGGTGLDEVCFHLVRSAGRVEAGAVAAFSTSVPAVLRARLEELIVACSRTTQMARAGLAMIEARMRDIENETGERS